MAKKVIYAEIVMDTDDAVKNTVKILDAVEDTESAIKKTNKEASGMKKAFVGAKKGAKALSAGIRGMGKALKAAGIGLLIAGFIALKEAMERNQSVMDSVDTVMTTISTTFNDVVNVLIDTVKWVQKSSDRFDGLSKVLTGIITVALTPLQLAFYGIKLGVEELMLAWEDSIFGSGDVKKIKELQSSIIETKTNIIEITAAALKAGADIVNNVADAIGEIGEIYEVASEGISKISVEANFEQAKAATALTKAAGRAAVEFAKLNAEFLRDAELQRQIRDDETKTFEERIEANNKLNALLTEQQNLQREQVQIGIDAAQAQFNINASEENYIALQERKVELLELEETITGQMSEQKVNQVALERELAAVKNELFLDGLSGIASELAELELSYELKKEMARKSGVDISKITGKYEEEKANLIKSYEVNTKDDRIAAAVGTVDAISSITGNLATVFEGNAKAQKSISIAQALIDTYKGATAAYTSLAPIPIVGVPLGIAAAATAVAAGLANVKRIKNTKISKGSAPSASGGGGGRGGSFSGKPSGDANNFFPTQIGAIPQNTSNVNVQNLNNTPPRAYIVASDIADSTRAQEILKQKSTL